VLDDEHFGALFRYVFGQSCAAQAAACDGNIVRCRHVFFLPGDFLNVFTLAGVKQAFFRRKFQAGTAILRQSR